MTSAKPWAHFMRHTAGLGWEIFWFGREFEFFARLIHPYIFNSRVSQLYPQYQYLDSDQKLVFLFKIENEQLITWVGKFVYGSFCLREEYHGCCGHQIGLIYFIQYFQLVFLWNAFGRPTGVFRGRFTWYLNGILEFCICLVMTWFAVPMFI